MESNDSDYRWLEERPEVLASLTLVLTRIVDMLEIILTDLLGLAL